MNADLALYLIEKGIPLDKAKAIATEATNEADVAFGVLDALPGAMSVAEARELAANAPLANLRVPVPLNSRQTQTQQETKSASIAIPEHDTKQVAHGVYTPVLGPDGLTDGQRAAIANGVGLCPNCQQPKDNHLPGCARVGARGFEPVDPKAVTKDRLSPSV